MRKRLKEIECLSLRSEKVLAVYYDWVCDLCVIEIDC